MLGYNVRRRSGGRSSDRGQLQHRTGLLQADAAGTNGASQSLQRRAAVCACNGHRVCSGSVRWAACFLWVHSHVGASDAVITPPPRLSLHPAHVTPAATWYASTMVLTTASRAVVCNNPGSGTEAEYDGQLAAMLTTIFMAPPQNARASAARQRELRLLRLQLSEFQHHLQTDADS